MRYDSCCKGKYFKECERPSKNCLKAVISTLCYFCDLGYLLLHLAKDYQACLILNCVLFWIVPAARGSSTKIIARLGGGAVHFGRIVSWWWHSRCAGAIGVCAQFGGVSSRAQSSWSFPKLKGDSKGGATPSSFDRACLLRILDRSIPSISCHWTTPCSEASAVLWPDAMLTFANFLQCTCQFCFTTCLACTTVLTGRRSLGGGPGADFTWKHDVMFVCRVLGISWVRAGGDVVTCASTWTIVTRDPKSSFLLTCLHHPGDLAICWFTFNWVVKTEIHALCVLAALGGGPAAAFTWSCRANFGDRIFLRRIGATRRSGRRVGLPAFCLWNPPLPTWAAKFLATEVAATCGCHAALRWRRGGPRIVVRWLRSRLVVGTFFFIRFAFGTFFFQGCAAKVLEAGIFGNAFALRSVWLAAWDAQNCGTFVALAVCHWNLLPPACAAKVWDAEIFAKQGRHAAFRSRRGWPKIVVRWLHSRLVVGTFFFQGLPLEPSSAKVAPRKFWERKIWRSIGATQRFDRNAGSPKLWQVGWIRGLPSGLAFANLGRENFAYRIFSEA